jgi:predicted AAA+ superfamily ATPase
MSAMNVFDAILERFNIIHSHQRIALLKFMVEQRGSPFSLAQLKAELNGASSEEELLANIKVFEQHELIRKFYEDPYAEGYLKDLSTYYICD